MFLQISVFVAGICLGLAFIKSKNILAPWIGHQLSDAILDAVLKVT